MAKGIRTTIRQTTASRINPDELRATGCPGLDDDGGLPALEMPGDQRDELGPLPKNIATLLTPCHERGSRAAVRANLAIASGLVVVIPDARTPDRFTAMRSLIGAARAYKLPYSVVDPSSELDDVRRFVDALPPTSGSVRLMITGPRSTRWPAGERTAWQVVARLAVA